MKRVIERIRKILYRLPLVQQLGLQLIIGLLISFACLGVFSAIAEDVIEKDRLVDVDLAIANALYAAATPQSTTAYRVISLIGLEGVWLMGVLVGVFFVIRRQWLHLAVWVIALIGGTLLNDTLKLIFARARPSFVDPLVVERNFSFPSGHAMMSLIGYGLFAYFAGRALPNRYGRIVFIFAISLLIILIGISRMALGVHYLSDVVAGFAAGGVWLAACITAMNTIDRRKRSGDPAATEES